jgi:hypothetical protein
MKDKCLRAVSVTPGISVVVFLLLCSAVFGIWCLVFRAPKFCQEIFSDDREPERGVKQ